MYLRIYSFAFLLLFIFSTKGISQENMQLEKANPWFSDFVMGPYLFVEHIPYESVLLYGTRLGKRLGNLEDPRWSIVLEYVVGQQDDDQNTLGLTHNVSLHASYFLNTAKSTFRPYVYGGGGFLEFKSFSMDEYNMAYYGGIGFQIQMRDSIYSIIEPRYLNLAPFSFEEQHEIGIFWGVRILY